MCGLMPVFQVHSSIELGTDLCVATVAAVQAGIQPAF